MTLFDAVKNLVKAKSDDGTRVAYQHLIQAYDAHEAYFSELDTEPPCKTGSQCISGKCEQCIEPDPEPVTKQWVGLTSAETKVLWNLTKKPSEFAEAIATKLKEKNT